MLELTRPLVILDVETTGLHPKTDRVVQIGIVKLYPDNKRTEWSSLIKPGIPIPPEVTEIHGISDEMVHNAPTFKQVAPMLASGLMGCDIGGFGVRFDLDFLKAEFKRVGADSVLNGAEIIDPLKIYYLKHPRTLTAAVKEYLGEDLPNAHDALVDARAAARVLGAMLERHSDLPRTVSGLFNFFKTLSKNSLDAGGKIAWRHGEATLNFGEYATVSLRKVPRSFLKWMLYKDFSPEVKKIIEDALDGKYPQREDPLHPIL